MKIHLRILTSFFELIKHEDNQKNFVNFISNMLNKIVEKIAEKRKNKGQKERTLTNEELEKLSKKLFWNINFFCVYGLIDKIIHSAGSDKLTEIIVKVCDNENTPASFLVKHGILMWYNKNLQIDNIYEKFIDKNFSEIAKKVLKLMIINHCSMHSINFKERQKIENKFGIS